MAPGVPHVAEHLRRRRTKEIRFVRRAEEPPLKRQNIRARILQQEGFTDTFRVKFGMPVALHVLEIYSGFLK